MYILKFLLIVSLIISIFLPAAILLNDDLHLIKYGIGLIFILLILITINESIIIKYESHELDESITIKYDNIILEQVQIDHINQQLRDIVIEYANHEEAILLKNNNIEGIMVAGKLYPELKSNELYVSLMDSYENHNNNLVTGIKDYNQMVGERRLMSYKPVIGRLVKPTDFKTITHTKGEL